MGGLGSHLAPAAQPRRHLLDEMGGSRNFDLLAFGNFEPSAGERRLDLCTGHALRPHHLALCYLASVATDTVNPPNGKENP